MILQDSLQIVPPTFTLFGIPWWNYLGGFFVVRLILVPFSPRFEFLSGFGVITGLEISRIHFGISIVKDIFGGLAYLFLLLAMIYFIVLYFLSRKNRERVRKLDKMEAEIGPIEIKFLQEEDYFGYTQESRDAVNLEEELDKIHNAAVFSPDFDFNFVV